VPARPNDLRIQRDGQAGNAVAILDESACWKVDMKTTATTALICSPRLAHSDQAADYEMDVREVRDAGPVGNIRK
jgi:hypothetical protein